MSAEENKAMFRRLMDEVVNKGNLDIIDELVAADVVEHEELLPGLPQNREGVKQFFAILRSAFPDIKATIEDVIAEGDKVVARGTMSGTHQGEFMGIPATGKKVSFGAIDILRITNGKFVEHWGLTDSMAMMQQLGVIPGPGAG
jgi:steroid delta-isomerase-like uncharacterized protein